MGTKNEVHSVGYGCFTEDAKLKPESSTATNYRYMGVKTARACQKICQERHDCEFFEYYPHRPEKQCYLKRGPVTEAAIAGTMIGPKFC